MISTARRGPVTTTIHVPAPIGGLDALSPPSAMPPGKCSRLVNLIALESGLCTRLGSREWVTNLTGGLGGAVLSLLPFAGSNTSGSTDKLFACTASGIWDVSASSSAPTQAIAFDLTNDEAGRGESAGFVTAGGHFLLYTDEANGLYVYSESASSWTKVTAGSDAATQIQAGSGSIPDSIDPATFCAVGVWKGRVWFAIKNTASACYAAEAGAIFGNYVGINFGQQFRRGGPLRNLWNWTLDAGAGLDDMLVIASGGGDVLVYEGVDPTSAETFGIRGAYDAGGFPAGRRLAISLDGNLLLLTKSGIRNMRSLIAPEESEQYLTRDIGPLVNSLMLSKAGLQGWSMHLHPEDPSLMVLVPQGSDEYPTQLAMSLHGKAWGPYRKLPMTCACVWNGKLYFGTPDGRVMVNDGYMDEVPLDISAFEAEDENRIGWSVLQPLPSADGRNKRVHLVRPHLRSEEVAPRLAGEARYGYDETEVAAAAIESTGEAAWDEAEFDEAVFAGDRSSASPIQGATGIGSQVAIAVAGSSVTRTTLVGCDLWIEAGGSL